MNRTIETARGAISIRQARVEDSDRFRTLRLDALLDSPAAFSADYESDATQNEGFWQERITSNEKKTLYLAEATGAMIGMTGILRGGSSKTRHSAWLWGVYVTPAWRGLRVADELITACVDWARAAGVITVKLGVAATNRSAIRCYERCGFTVFGTEPLAMHHGGVFHDELLMYRLLKRPETRCLDNEAQSGA